MEIPKAKKITPFVASFLEKKTEYDLPASAYSEDSQVNILDPGDVQNPLYMSPTKLHTSGGDSIGDEAH